jgi:hypothetical protein
MSEHVGEPSAVAWNSQSLTVIVLVLSASSINAFQVSLKAASAVAITTSLVLSGSISQGVAFTPTSALRSPLLASHSLLRSGTAIKAVEKCPEEPDVLG